MRRLIIALTIISLAVSAASAAETAAQILRRALDLSAGIKDYSAEITATMDLPSMQVPRRTAKVFFKRPDKVAIQSRGVVMIPKRALVPGNIGTELTKDTQVTIIGQSRRDGYTMHSLKVVEPGRPSGDRLLLWVRGDRYTVERLEVYSRSRRELAVDWTYQLLDGKHWMPRRLVAQLAPMGKEKKAGLITVDFTNVRVNRGLSDKIFEESKP